MYRIPRRLTITRNENEQTPAREQRAGVCSLSNCESRARMCRQMPISLAGPAHCDLCWTQALTAVFPATVKGVILALSIMFISSESSSRALSAMSRKYAQNVRPSFSASRLVKKIILFRESSSSSASTARFGSRLVAFDILIPTIVQLFRCRASEASVLGTQHRFPA